MVVQHWGVDVRVNGERVLTIESNCLSGIDNIDDYADTVRECAHRLLLFIGESKPDNIMELGTDTQQTKGEICPDCGSVAISIGNNNFLCGCEPDR